MSTHILVKRFAMVAMLYFVIASCSVHITVKEVPYPFIQSSLYDFSDITKVVLSDTATTVSISSHFIPNYTIENADWKICIDGKEYLEKGSIGLNPDGKIVYDDSGSIEFSVIFEPIPKRVRCIDVHSGVECFDFFGVDLTQTVRETQDGRIHYQEDLSEPLVFDESFGESTINVHLLNFKPGMKADIDYAIIGIVGSSSGEMHVDGKGDATVSFPQKGSAIYQVCFSMTQTSVDGIVNPGEEIDVMIDLNCFGHNIMKGRENYKESGIRYIATSDRHQSILREVNPQFPIPEVFCMSDNAEMDEISKAQSYLMKASTGEMTEEDFNVIDSFKWKFLTESIHSIQNEVMEKLASSSYSVVQEWQGPEEWIKQIIEPFKGKVIMIDLWNTWCSPCRSALTINEPLKDDVLSSNDIVWIYIVDESSPIIEYREYIKTIRGLHYRLNKEQMKDLKSYLNVDGIPFYVLVEKDGTFNGRPDLRNHSKYVQELLNRSEEI